jgi:hypothetical protein
MFETRPQFGNRKTDRFLFTNSNHGFIFESGIWTQCRDRALRFGDRFWAVSEQISAADHQMFLLAFSYSLGSSSSTSGSTEGWQEQQDQHHLQLAAARAAS